MEQQLLLLSTKAWTLYLVYQGMLLVEKAHINIYHYGYNPIRNLTIIVSGAHKALGNKYYFFILNYNLH